MKISKLLLLLSTVIAFTACQKELKFDDGLANTDSSSVVGAWKFISMQTDMNLTLEGEQNGVPMSVVATSNYTTINNGGTITFDNNQMIAAGLTYSVDAIAKATVYVAGIPVNTSDVPITGTVPPTDDTGAYEQFGADSIYVQSGALAILDPGGVLQNTGLGFKLKWIGNQMTMTTRIQTITSEDYMGIPVTANADITAVFTLEKQ
jgi:hypothetical protein